MNTNTRKSFFGTEKFPSNKCTYLLHQLHQKQKYFHYLSTWSLMFIHIYCCVSLNQINTKVSISLIHIMTKLYMEKNPEKKIHTIIKVSSLKGVKLRSITHGNMSKMTKFSLKKAHEKRDNSHWTV